MSRIIHISVTVEVDGKTQPATPAEQARAAAKMLRKSCAAGGADGLDAAQVFTVGLSLVSAGLSTMDVKMRTAVVKDAIQKLKQILPVRCQWNIYGENGEAGGVVHQWVSQAEAEARWLNPKPDTQ